ncbi:MAG: TetR/AcrR family transcriptional regulator [Pseudonocardia sp.]
MEPPVKSRRDEHADATRDALLDVGRRFFVEPGYAQSSAEGIVRAARLTRGALYHHFGGKQGLFRAVFEALEQEAATEINATLVEHTGDPWRQLLAGIDTFLRVCTHRDYRRIVLQEGPVALGPRLWREIDERYLLAALRDALERLVDAGIIERRPIDLLTRSMYAFLTELAECIADADDEHAARADAADLARGVFTGLTVRESPL